MRQLRFLALALVALVAATAGLRADDPVTVVLVRHAETTGSTSEPGADPPLSDAGRARAAALARELTANRVTHLFTSEALRCRETLAPLAEARKLEPKTIPAREVDKLVAALRALPPGSFAVVAGHSNTVPKVVEALGGKMSGLVDDPRGALIPHDDYGRMVVLMLGGEGASASTIEMRYGDEHPAPTKAEAKP